MRLACIGIGSNAIRMLSAEWDGAALTDTLRLRHGTRLFAGLVNGALTEESIRSSAEAVRILSEEANRSGARETFLFATSAVRDASNGEKFLEACREAAGRMPEVLTGEQEAVYSYLGACRGTRAAVTDIGGGSTELTLGEGRVPFAAVSLQLGAVRLSRELRIESAAEYEAAAERALSVLDGAARAFGAEAEGRVWTGVGGTMTTLGAMIRETELFEEGGCEGMTVTPEEVRGWGRRLSAMPMEARRRVPGLMPRRADIMPAGLAILDAVMRRFGCREMHLSNRGNMDGYLKERFRERARGTEEEA